MADTKKPASRPAGFLRMLLLCSLAANEANDAKSENCHGGWFWNCSDHRDVVDMRPGAPSVDELQVGAGRGCNEGIGLAERSRIDVGSIPSIRASLNVDRT